MRAQPKRICPRGRFDLDDWLLPVLYQQQPLDLSFAMQAATRKKESMLPEEFRRENNPYGFIGRDGPLLALERAMHRAPAGILIQRLGGRQRNEHLAASTYHQLARVPVAQQRLVEGGRFSSRAMLGFRTDPHSALIAKATFVQVDEAASAKEKTELEALWAQAGLGPFPGKENA